VPSFAPAAPSGRLLGGPAADECCGISCHQVWCTAQLAQAVGELTQDGKQVGVLHVADAALPANKDTHAYEARA